MTQKGTLHLRITCTLLLQAVNAAFEAARHMTDPNAIMHILHSHNPYHVQSLLTMFGVYRWSSTLACIMGQIMLSLRVPLTSCGCTCVCCMLSLAIFARLDSHEVSPTPDASCTASSCACSVLLVPVCKT